MEPDARVPEGVLYNVLRKPTIKLCGKDGMASKASAGTITPVQAYQERCEKAIAEMLVRSLVCRPNTELLIAYERCHYRGGSATEIGVGLQTRVQEMAAGSRIEAAPVHTATLKRFATGRGNADKVAMMEAAREYLGRAPIDDNEADAVHVARWAAAEYALGGYDDDNH